MCSKKDYRLKKVFGVDEYGQAVLPVKISNIQISRIFNAEKRGGCTICFPHGVETSNSSLKKNRRSWKYKRNHQYKAFEPGISPRDKALR